MPRLWSSALAGAVAALAIAGAAQAQTPTLLNGMFQDHAVLQRDRPIPVWGRAAAGEAVSLTFAGRTARTVADSRGRWRADLPALPAGGPYSLVVHTADGRTQAIADVLVGDVWLCAGQSNMQLPVRYAGNAFNEQVEHADDPGIRLLQIARADSRTPLDDLPRPQPWRAVSPESVAEFSAACFDFGRELKKTVKIPLGLIDASWGGSAIESWLTPSTLRRLGYGDRMDLLELSTRDPAAGDRRWGEIYQAWWRAQNPDRLDEAPWRADAVGAWRAAPAGLGYWETWGVPKLAEFDGLVWFRTTVDLTAAQARQAAVLGLGTIDDVDTTWVNEEVVGTTADASLDRTYRLRPGLLKPGRNTIVIAALDSWGTGGVYGPADKRALRLGAARLPLDNPWSYRIESPAHGKAPRAPWDALFGVSVIRNGMIAPMGPFALRGVAWYQGESNVDAADRYAGLLGGLMADLRAGRDPAMPFLVVQLAGFGARSATTAPSHWAELREAQRRAVAADAHSGLAVSIDIGDPYDVHPAEKQELGRRLARAARHVAYGDPAAPSGPQPLAARLEGGRVVVSFGEVTGRLKTYSSDRAVGFELCGSDEASCAFTGGPASGDEVSLDLPGGPAPARVRFCWADSPTCNLSDDTDLPAGPFEIPIR